MSHLCPTKDMVCVPGSCPARAKGIVCTVVVGLGGSHVVNPQNSLLFQSQHVELDLGATSRTDRGRRGGTCGCTLPETAREDQGEPSADQAQG